MGAINGILMGVYAVVIMPLRQPYTFNAIVFFLQLQPIIMSIVSIYIIF